MFPVHPSSSQFIDVNLGYFLCRKIHLALQVVYGKSHRHLDHTQLAHMPSASVCWLYSTLAIHHCHKVQEMPSTQSGVSVETCPRPPGSLASIFCWEFDLKILQLSPTIKWVCQFICMFSNRATPKMYGLERKIRSTWILWGYPYFRKLWYNSFPS